PTKSRLTMASVRCQVVLGAAQKETWGSPTSRSGRSVAPEYTPGSVDAQPTPSPEHGPRLSAAPPRRSSGLRPRAQSLRRHEGRRAPRRLALCFEVIGATEDQDGTVAKGQRLAAVACLQEVLPRDPSVRGRV